MGYKDVYADWLADPEAFWLKQAEAVDWIRSPTRALFDGDTPFYEWFSDAQVNTCWNALDRHVAAGHGDRTAVIHDSPVTGTKSRLTYAQLLDRVARLAGALQARGVTKGDTVVIYMPMVPEALIAMLACARIGAIHSVVFGGFAARELAARIEDAQPKAILAASCGIEPSGIVRYKPLLDEAIEIAAHDPEFCVIVERPQFIPDMTSPRDIDWQSFVQDAEAVDCVAVAGNDPLYILYTSGTTGKPKGVVRHNGGHLVALAWTMRSIYDIQPGEVFWTASDVGWVVGHSYICYGPLVNGSTTVVYEGKPVGTPDAGAFWRVIEEHKVKALFTAPTAFRAIRREDPEGALIEKHDLSSLKALYLAGERADPTTIDWATRKLNVPVIDHWWQTETGSAICANPIGIEQLPIKPGSPTVPMPGHSIEVLGEDGEPVTSGQLGALAIRLPLPPGTLPGLWRAPDRYQQAYLSRFPGYYETGDSGFVDEDGYVYIMSRTDDVVNIAGHRLSTGAMEEVLATHPDVVECAVIGVSDKVKGQRPIGLLCLSTSCIREPSDVATEVIDLVRKEIGPVASFKTAIAVKRLPKTRSGKILRSAMAKLADGEDPAIPPTIDDPAIIDEIRQAFQNAGVLKRP
ncbi:propionyl-CoA synthetase [Qingshengfaniella alkalisoli]|uniref:Propionyl-CoA synthetase n=1 Tax=Qingshengfaniella alkalisoli TaxID=2599296 RepID=A0A5B8ISX1_9RHOB|nr:propionyl-CoA synthetase [Qingshengfaniella alkalisoli]QDY68533.1 propionyl-CoA synthetase [Qingshengfaniella alkalisoli]